MPVNETKKQLCAVLAEKSVEELEELLALEFSEEEGFEPDVDYITEIMEVIREKEPPTEDKQAESESAWSEFQEYLQARSAETPETGIDGAPSNSDHSCNSNMRQISRKKPTRILRYIIAAAAILVLLCGTTYASHQGLFRALAAWTAETFGFLMPGQEEPVTEDDPFANLRLEVENLTDTPAVPKWAPEGTEILEEVVVFGREDRTRIAGRFGAADKEFTIRIIVHGTSPENYTGTYQKDEETEDIYEAGGIVHSIMDNHDNVSVSWLNGCVEGHIQGNVSLDQLKDMIDSIYKE